MPRPPRSMNRVITIGNNLRHLWFGIPPLSDVRGQPSGSMVVHLEAVNEPGDACCTVSGHPLHIRTRGKTAPVSRPFDPENRSFCRRCCYPKDGKTWSSTICPRQDRYGVPGRSLGTGPFRHRVITIGNKLRHLWFGIPPLSDVRGQPSGSMVVHLEAVNEPGDACCTVSGHPLHIRTRGKTAPVSRPFVP